MRNVCELSDRLTKQIFQSRSIPNLYLGGFPVQMRPRTSTILRSFTLFLHHSSFSFS